MEVMRQHGRGNRRGKHHQKFSEHQMRARDRAAKNRFDRAALFFARGQIHCRIHCAGQAQQNHEVRNHSAQDRAAHFFRRGDVFLLGYRKDAPAFPEDCGRPAVRARRDRATRERISAGGRRRSLISSSPWYI